MLVVEILGCIVLAWALLKIGHGLGLTPWPHTWEYSHKSYENKIALDTKNNCWIDQSRIYHHYYCLYCDEWSDV